jgi:hypothetical protein
MKHDEINIAIAEHCGWIWNEACVIAEEHFQPCWTKGTGEMADRVPNYAGDLNACAELEKTLESKPLQEAYVQELSEFIPHAFFEEAVNVFDIIHLSALQRCEAFLRTVGKWAL